MKCIIVKKKNLSKNAVEITFKPQGDFKFIAGQSVKITISNITTDPIGNTRSFSIASSPDEENISIIVRTHEDIYPFKQFLVNAPLGTEIDFSEPKGSFILPENKEINLVFIAGGIGITPFLSMINFCSQRNFTGNIHLVYFNTSAEEEIYAEELHALSDINKHFRISEFYDSLKTGILKGVLVLDAGVMYYIAGPPGMVAQAIESLKVLGVPDSQIKTEEFKGYS